MLGIEKHRSSKPLLVSHCFRPCRWLGTVSSCLFNISSVPETDSVPQSSGNPLLLEEAEPGMGAGERARERSEKGREGGKGEERGGARTRACLGQGAQLRIAEPPNFPKPSWLPVLALMG